MVAFLFSQSYPLRFFSLLFIWLIFELYYFIWGNDSLLFLSAKIALFLYLQLFPFGCVYRCIEKNESKRKKNSCLFLRRYRTMSYEELRWYFQGRKRHFFEIIVKPIIRKSNAFIPENSSKSSYVICAVSPSLLLFLSNNFFCFSLTFGKWNNYIFPHLFIFFLPPSLNFRKSSLPPIVK